MSLVKMYVRAMLDVLFVVGVIVLLLLLRYISKGPRIHQSVLSEPMNSLPAANDSNQMVENNVDILPTATVRMEPGEQQSMTANPEDEAAIQVQERQIEPEEERAQEPEDSIERIEAYCVKCREKREMQNGQRIVTKKGRKAMEGTCPVCGTKLFRFIAH